MNMLSQRGLYLFVILALSLINLKAQAAQSYVDTQIAELSSRIDQAQFDQNININANIQNAFAQSLVDLFNQRNQSNIQEISNLLNKAKDSPLLTQAQKEYVINSMLSQLPAPQVTQMTQGQIPSLYPAGEQPTDMDRGQQASMPNRVAPANQPTGPTKNNVACVNVRRTAYGHRARIQSQYEASQTPSTGAPMSQLPEEVPATQPQAQEPQLQAPMVGQGGAGTLQGGIMGYYKGLIRNATAKIDTDPIGAIADLQDVINRTQGQTIDRNVQNAFAKALVEVSTDRVKQVALYELQALLTTATQASVLTPSQKAYVAKRMLPRLSRRLSTTSRQRNMQTTRGRTNNRSPKSRF